MVEIEALISFWTSLLVAVKACSPVYRATCFCLFLKYIKNPSWVLGVDGRF